MARVTKINVGGTNYDIAHEGELKNSGFEVVTALPTTGLFEGREVMYNGKKYVYSSGWKEEITANTMCEANLRWGGRNIGEGYSPVDAAMISELSSNIMAFPNPAGISIEYSRDGGVTWLDYGATDEQKVKVFTTESVLYCGKSKPDGLLATVGYQLRITITPETCGVYTELNKIIMETSVEGTNDCWCTFKGLTLEKFNAGHKDDTDYDIFVNKAKIYGWPTYSVLNFETITTAYYSGHLPYYRKLRLIFGYDTVQYQGYNGFYLNLLRFFGPGRWILPSKLAASNHLYSYEWKQNAFFPKKVQSKEIINFDVNNIEPTQSGSNVSKTSTWLWQYLVQAVNWLKANNVRLSAYNTKVAALEQADSDNNTLSQSVRSDLTELSNGLAAVARSGSYNDLTDKPTLATVATSGSYNDLTDKPTFSGSYNDLTDKPTLATVATSGSYNDLTDKPTFSGSYNDLTDKPTLFSGSYDDLTNKPTLATVATSGDYDDLLNKPALVFQNIGGTISLVQIPDGLIANTKLANSSMTLNDTTVNLGDTSILPWYVDYNETDYPARIREHWLQIYRNGVWANLVYLGDILPTQVGQITSLDNLDWYNEQVSEYEVDSNTTTSILNGTTLPATVLMNCLAEQLTLNFYPISGKQYGKGSLDSLITNLQDKGFSVFVENDLDAIQQSGSDYLVRLKISKVPTAKAIIECYVAR